MRTPCLAKLTTPAAILLIVAAPLFAAEQVPKTYGAGVSIDKPVPLLKLLDKPEKYVGKPVRVEGTVGDVCPRMGCWMEIRGKDAERHVRFKVKDGEMVFPMEAKGRRVIAQGVLERVELDPDEALAWARHLAEEKGEPFDDTTEVPTVFYQIRGTGAVIH